MLDDKISKLSDVQKQCLRLAGEGRSSKEIAPLVGLSHQTVDQYLHRARLALGAENRRDAARMFADFERGTPFKQFELKPKGVVLQQDSGISEAQTMSQQSSLFMLGLPQVGGPPNDLNLPQRLLAIGKIALLLMIMVMAMVIIAKGAFIVLS